MKRVLAALVSIIIAAISIAACNAVSDAAQDIGEIESYKDIPGVTDGEISAIEGLKAEIGGFVYAGLTSTELYAPDGVTYTGFTVRLCELLTNLFEIEFSPKPYSDWVELKDGLEKKDIDFTGDLTSTPERMREYYLTHAISERSLSIFTHKDSAEIVSESDIEGRSIGIYSGSVTADQIKKYYPVSFKTVYAGNISEIVEMLESGEIDAFVTDSVADISFEGYDFICSKVFFSLVYSPVSIATANPELEPVISVINKYLSAGGVDKLYELSKESGIEYARYKLGRSYTAEERAYLNDLANSGTKVKIGLEYDNYPVSFYNEKDGEYQGIAIDVIAGLSEVTGIQFESEATKDMPWAAILYKLKSGEISMTAELLYSDSRKNDYIWCSTPYASSYYALISKSDYPYLANYQVIRAQVGTIEKTAHEDMYYAWFPDSDNTTRYTTQHVALSALEKGEIDLLMASEYMLLAQTNYLEKPGYKVNIRFSSPMESMFGFNKNETVLCSIIDKAQAFVDTETIDTSWTTRNYDYSKKLADQRSAYLAVFVVILTAVLIFLTILLYKNKRLSKVTESLEMHEAESRQAALLAEESSRMKSLFLANMSHEIRTPMNSIVGFSELALDSNPKPEVRDLLEKIKKSSDILLTIINDILDITKIESGRIILENIPFSMHDLFTVCRTLIEPRAIEKGVALHCYAEPSIGKKILGDPTRLRQVLLNLLSNAVKFTNEGMVKIFAGIEDSSEDSVTIRFEVKDSGIGMTQEQIERIFEPFMQADVSTTRRYGGTGLGLTITKSIVELMGGNLMVESTPGVGSKFSFVLTFKTVDSDDKKENILGFTKKPIFNGKVLVCEDNPLNQEVVRAHLAKVGLSSVIAQNGAEAVEMTASAIKNNEPFDLIFMDIHMPVMDGLEAARELAKLGNKSPVIALTANIMPGARDDYMANGMQDYLAKPFKSEDLWNCLIKYLVPVGFSSAPAKEEAADAENRNKRLLKGFARDNQTTFKDISSAIIAGDSELAYRLAHTLKGTAGLIGKGKLMEAARRVERTLEDKDAKLTQAQMDKLDLELGAVLKELSPLLNEPEHSIPQPKELDREKTLALLDKLDGLLECGNSDSLDLIRELRCVPETEALITQLERYDFIQARDTLNAVRRNMEEYI